MAADLKLLPQGERLLSGKLSSGITAIATTMDVNNPPAASKLPTYLEIDYGTDEAEVVRVIDVSGNTLTIERGVNSGGVGVEHLVNANYKQKITHQFATLVTTALQNGWLPEDTSYTFTRVSTSSFKVTASGVDRTALYFAGRFIRLNGTILVTIASSSYSNPDTTIVVKETTVPTPITSIELGVSPQGVDIIAQRKATGSEINTGTEDGKIVTPKGINDSKVVSTAKAITNNEAITQKDSGGTARNILKTNSSNVLEIGDSNLSGYLFNTYDTLGGWIPYSGTWTYASSTTFTISGDKTGVFTKGDKIRLKQGGGYKYFYIVGVSYSSPNTTITVSGGSDYSLANSSITDTYYSHGNAVGFPNVFNWTPTLTGGNAKLSGYDYAYFSIEGRMLSLVFGTSNKNVTGSAGQIEVSVPVAVALGGVGRFGSFTFFISSYSYARAALDTKITLYKDITSGSWSGSETGVYIQLNGSYWI